MELIVVGMHRSGTSLLTGCLYRMGAYFGDLQLSNGSNIENPEGFWERKDVRQLNDQLLDAGGCDWDRVSEFRPELISQEAISKFEQNAATIAEEIGQFPVSVLKEPRFCILLPFWEKLFRDPVIVHICRHPCEVAQSLNKSNGIPIMHGIALWEFYNRNAFYNTRGHRRFLIGHQELLFSPIEELSNLLGELRSLGVEGMEDPCEALVEDFFDLDLYRNRNSASTGNRWLNESQQQLWESMKEKTIFMHQEEVITPNYLQDSLGTFERNRNLDRIDQKLDDIKKKLNLSEQANRDLEQQLSNTEMKLKASEQVNQDLEQRLSNTEMKFKASEQESQKLINWLSNLESVLGQILQSHRYHLASVICNLSQILVSRMPRRIKQSTLLRETLKGLLSSFFPKGAGHPEFDSSIEKTMDSFSVWKKGRARKMDNSLIARTEQRDKITVVVPVYNAYEQIKCCVESVIKCTHIDYRLLLIDDASTDSRILPMLTDFQKRNSHIDLVMNAENQGYTRTVNIGCKQVFGDVVLLNSDTVVTDRWLTKLRAAANSNSNVATVTALSNAAGAFSVPLQNEINQLPEQVTVSDMGRYVEHLSERLYPEAPTGNGFCMYINREVFDTIGYFDERRFPRGYGEENDFCMRARHSGFVHVIDDSTFVFHERNASFGDEKKQLMEQARKELHNQYPEYRSMVAEWLSHDPLKCLRNSLSHLMDQKIADSQALRAKVSKRQHILFVLHDADGGTKLTSNELAQETALEFNVSILRCGIRKWWLEEITPDGFREIQSWNFENSWRIQDRSDRARIQAFEDVLKEQEIHLVHFRHFIANEPEIVEVSQKFGCRTVLSFHDFYNLCPTIQLINGEGKYCAGKCTGTGSCSATPYWFGQAFPKPLKDQYVHQWRSRVNQAIKDVDTFITTSEYARELIQEHLSSTRTSPFEVIHHGRNIEHFSKVGVCPDRIHSVRVVVLGAINQSKGASLIMELLKRNQRQGNPIEVHFFGKKSREFHPSRFGAIDHGSYQPEELSHLLSAIKPSLSLIASIWPETYCHTLTESWALGIPVLVSPLGALRERVENNGGGWFFDPSRVESILETVQTIRDNPDQWWSRRNEIEVIPSRSTRDMSREYVRIYKRLVGLPLKEKTLCLERASRNQQGQDITEQTVSNNTNQNVSRFGTKGHHLKSRGLKRV